MKVLSRIFFWLGVAGVVAAIIIGWQPGWNVYTQYLALSAGRSLEFDNPLPPLALALVVVLLSGFLMGLGVGMIRRKPKTAESPQAQPSRVDPVPQPDQLPTPDPNPLD